MASEFSGIADRCEVVGIVDGVKYINSSIDTSPARMAATLTALGTEVAIIIGGRGKGLSILPYLDVIRKYARKIAFYGEAGREFKEELSSVGVTIPSRWSDGFDDAFHYARRGLGLGETILLSPAATSYGEFQNYKERGERFRLLVRELKK